MITSKTQCCVPVFIAQGIILHNNYCPGIASYLQSEVTLDFPAMYYKLEKKSSECNNIHGGSTIAFFRSK